MRLLRRILSVSLAFGFAAVIQADEGMWMPHQMKDLDPIKFGLKMSPDDIFKRDGTEPKSAVVQLGGGTGEFVSADGLILTNHHVAFGAIQRASTKEQDYLEKGFLSGTREKENPAQVYSAYVLLGYE